MAERSICLTLPFPTADFAALAHEVLSVDKEIRRSEVRRELTTEGANLIINLQGIELKKLRVSLNGILKNLLLIVKTADQFKS